MKVYHIASRPTCPLRIQMSDDGQVAAIQVRDEQGYAFYWLLVSSEVAQKIIAEHSMTVVYTLPDTPADYGVGGYTPMRREPTFDTYDKAQKFADGLNEKMGLSKSDALEIVFSTMR